MSLLGIFVAFLLVVLSPLALAAFREDVHRVPVTLADQDGRTHEVTMVITVFRDSSRERSPFVLLSHGRSGDRAVRDGMGRVRYSKQAAWFVERGFAVVVPTRAGYGVTGGPDIERAGPCEAMDFPARFAAGAGQLAAALAWTRGQPWALPDRGVLVGQSFGGSSSLALSAQSPPGIVGVVNIAGGGGGDPRNHPESPCSAKALERTMARYGAGSTLPVLWLYSENDRYWGPALPRRWFDGFVAQGGQGRFVAMPPLADKDGHATFVERPESWQPPVAGFFRYLGFP